jgi:hypothetical protein
MQPLHEPPLLIAEPPAFDRLTLLMLAYAFSRRALEQADVHRVRVADHLPSFFTIHVPSPRKKQVAYTGSVENSRTGSTGAGAATFRTQSQTSSQ